MYGDEKYDSFVLSSFCIDGWLNLPWSKTEQYNYYFNYPLFKVLEFWEYILPRIVLVPQAAFFLPVYIREYGSTLYVGMARKKHGRLYISIASDELKSLVKYTDKF